MPLLLKHLAHYGIKLDNDIRETRAMNLKAQTAYTYAGRTYPVANLDYPHIRLNNGVGDYFLVFPRNGTGELGDLEHELLDRPMFSDGNVFSLDDFEVEGLAYELGMTNADNTGSVERLKGLSVYSFHSTNFFRSSSETFTVYSVDKYYHIGDIKNIGVTYLGEWTEQEKLDFAKWLHGLYLNNQTQEGKPMQMTSLEKNEKLRSINVRILRSILKKSELLLAYKPFDGTYHEQQLNSPLVKSAFPNEVLFRTNDSYLETINEIKSCYSAGYTVGKWAIDDVARTMANYSNIDFYMKLYDDCEPSRYVGKFGIERLAVSDEAYIKFIGEWTEQEKAEKLKEVIAVYSNN